MKTFVKIVFAVVICFCLVSMAQAQSGQGTITVTKWPAYIPAPTVDQDSTTMPPFAIYVTMTGGEANQPHYLKVGSPSYNDLTYQLFTYRNTGLGAGTWGRSTNYDDGNFYFKTDALGKWEGWIPVKAQKSGISQIAVRVRAPLGLNANINSSPVNITGMITAGTNGGYLVGNLLDGTAGTKENKIVIAYNGIQIRGIWFTEPDSISYIVPPLTTINEFHTNYTTALSFVNANGGFAMLVPNGTNSITKMEVYSYPNNTGASTPLATELRTYSEQNITIPNSTPSLGNTATVGIASNFLNNIRIPSGAGTASLVNNSGGTLNGSTIFPRTTSGLTVQLSITGVSIGPLDSARVTVPSDFTGLSSGNVTLGGAFSGKSFYVTGNQITIQNAALGTTAGTVTISGLTSSSFNGAQLNGNSKWTVETAGESQILTEIGSSPISYTIIPIKNIRTGGVDGFGNTSVNGDTVAMKNQVVAVAGVVTMESGLLQAPTNTSGIIQDAGYGIELFRYGTPTTSFNRYDSVVVKGVITPYNGATEIVPSTTTNPDFYNLGAGVHPSPKTFSNASAVAESLECSLVKITSVTYDSASKTFGITDINTGMNNFRTAPTDTGTIFVGINSTITGKTIPATGDPIGVVIQRNQYTGGHQKKRFVAPRDVVDLGMDPADGSGLAAISPAVNYTNQVAVKETLTVSGDGINTIAGVNITIPLSWTWTNTSSYQLLGAGFSGATSGVTGDGTTTPYVITVSGAAVTDVNKGIFAIYNLNTPTSSGVTRFYVQTKGGTGNAHFANITTSPSVNVAGAFEAVANGNWDSTNTWSRHIVPGPTDDVTMYTKNVIVTVSANATCHNLLMNGADPLGAALLQFPSTGASTLTVNGKLEITGTSTSRPRLNSNTNASAVLIVKGNVYTDVSNATPTNLGLNMNDGTVKLIGSTLDTLKTNAGFRLANLEIGDGTNAKTVVWVPTSAGNMVVRSVKVKRWSSFILGGTTYVQSNSIGNNTTAGLPMLTGGITIDTSASLTVNNANGVVAIQPTINLKGGGITNNGTLNLKSIDGSRKYYVSVGGLSADPTGSKQTIAGSATGSYCFTKISTLDTLILNHSMNMIDSSVQVDGVLSETVGKTVLGTVTAQRLVTQGVTESFGGIGVALNAASAAPGNTTIRRKTGVAQSGNGNTSILRYYDVAPSLNTGLGASADFNYDDGELNGQTAAQLGMWRSTDLGSTWEYKGGTVNTGLHKISVGGINAFSRWTASDVAHPLGSMAKQLFVNTGWNMVSIPYTLTDYHKAILFPTALSDAYAYDGSTYIIADPLANMPGYWLKFAAKETVTVNGVDRISDSVNVSDGWNMIGSISKPIDTASIVSSTPGLVLSSYYGYTNSYVASDTIWPGQAYWVKTGGAGKLYMHSSGLVAKPSVSPVAFSKQFNSLTITDKSGNHQTLYFGTQVDTKFKSSFFEMPPIGPEGTFDVRFSTQRYVEFLPEKIDIAHEYKINIQANAYPITISWNIKNDASQEFVMHDAAGSKQTLNGEGKTLLSKPIKSIFLQVSGREVLPTEFSLSGNYPNPFNPSTKFVIALPKAAYVDVSIYDILGRKVRTLLSGDKAAGYHTIEWNGLSDDNTSASTGVYFIRMLSEKFSSVHKIMMMK